MSGYWRDPVGRVEQPTDWLAVAIFFVVSCGWSAAAAHVPALAFPDRVGGLRIDNSILVGFGPALGALAATLARPRPKPTRSFLGLKPGWTLVALAAPTFSCLFVKAIFPAQPGYGWAFALSVTIYCLGEELGWRGWLHDALAGLAAWRAALITAALWYVWHWTFLAADLAKPTFGLGFAAGILVGSFALQAAVRRTRATGIAVAWHAAIKVLGAPAQLALMLAAIIMSNWAQGRVRKG